jgi:hypothetical protein
MTAAFFFLAGCAGGHSAPALPPPATTGTDASAMHAPLDAIAPTTGTLYFAEVGVVHAFPLGANGTTSSTRDIIPHPNQSQNIFGVAVNTDGTLDIMETLFNGTNQDDPHCRVVVESATASGSPPALYTNLCSGTEQSQADAIAANAFGGYDVLFNAAGAGATGPNQVARYANDGASVQSVLTLSDYPYFLASDRGGHDYTASGNGAIEEYRGSQTAGPAIATIAGGALGFINSVAVSPGADRTLYVGVGQYNQPNYIDAITLTPPSTYTISRRIGPFGNLYISAMAVDAQGELYVGMNPQSQTSNVSLVRVYAPDANGKPTPLRIIYPSPETSYVRGLAIAN